MTCWRNACQYLSLSLTLQNGLLQSPQNLMNCLSNGMQYTSGRRVPMIQIELLCHTWALTMPCGYDDYGRFFHALFCTEDRGTEPSHTANPWQQRLFPCVSLPLCKHFVKKRTLCSTKVHQKVRGVQRTAQIQGISILPESNRFRPICARSCARTCSSDCDCDIIVM